MIICVSTECHISNDHWVIDSSSRLILKNCKPCLVLCLTTYTYATRIVDAFSHAGCALLPCFCESVRRYVACTDEQIDYQPTEGGCSNPRSEPARNDRNSGIMMDYTGAPAIMHHGRLIFLECV